MPKTSEDVKKLLHNEYEYKQKDARYINSKDQKQVIDRLLEHKDKVNQK